MGLFDKLRETIGSTATPEDAPQTTDDVKAEQIREMSGYKDIKDVRKDAPGSDAEPVKDGKSNSKRPTQREVKARLDATTRTEQERDARRVQAMSTVGKDMCGEMAGLPYEIWSFYMSDPALRLQDDEQQKLAETYFMLAQAMEPDFSKPIYILPFAILMNVRMVGRRFAYMAIKKSTGRIVPPDQVEGVIMDELRNARKQ